MAVDSTHIQYDEASDDWNLIKDLLAGERAIKLSGQLYLPMLSGQDVKEYAAYRDRASFYNAFGRTAQGLTGAILRKDPDITSSDQIVDMTESLTRDGRSLREIASSCIKDVICYGRYGLLVDAPADGKSDPYIAEYKAKDILNWYQEDFGEGYVLTFLSLREWPDSYEDANYEVTQEENIRIYYIDPEDSFVKAQLYEWTEPSGNKTVKGTKSTGGAWQPVWKEPRVLVAGGKKLTEIPFFFFGPEDNTPTVNQSPLLDLANVNIAHWKMSADLAHGLHYTALPTPWAAGFDVKTKLFIGPSKAWISSDPSASCGYLEFTGQGLKSVSEDLDRKEKQMAVLGSRLIEGQRVGVEAAETARIRQSGEVNALTTVAKLISKGLSRVLEAIALWRNVSAGEEVTVELNTDFVDVQISSDQIKSLLLALQAGKISHETFLWNLKEGEMLPPGISIEDEKDLIETEKEDEDKFEEEFELEPQPVISRVLPVGTPALLPPPKEE